ncbi:MAG: RpoL/Rpb11 RNA polymerase subunit family protein [Candidatus Aenigmatarchaeota archaeon]
MQLKILGKGKNTLRVKFVGEDHSLLNLLRETIWDDNEAKIDSVSYKKKHPYMGDPILLIKTKEGDPEKVLKRASREIIKMSKDFRVELDRVN